jgi:hypothetical protein
VDPCAVLPYLVTSRTEGDPVTDGKVLASVDLNEINHKPMPARSPADHHPVTASLKPRG